MKKLQIFEGTVLLGQTVSIDFDGVTEQLESNSETVGFADIWTIAFWAKITDTGSRNDSVLAVGEFGAQPIQFLQRSSGAGTSPSYQIFTNINNVAWDDLDISDNVWHHVVLQWDTFSNAKFYLNGVDQGAETDIGAGPLEAQTFTNISREISIGGQIQGLPRLDGQFASLAIWDDYLTSAEITAIYNSGDIGIDLASDSGSYASSANLIHWFQLGRDSSDIGKDYGNASTLYDLMDNQVDISAADIVSDVPS